jgi:pimeloyl-ACP methyl ester carboxylesterase
MKDLFEGLGIQKTNLIGNSNGGFFALETALNLSERVEKVVLISPAATLVQMWAFWLRLLVPAHMLAPMLKSEGMVQRAYAWLWQDFPKSPEYSELKSISIVAGYPRYRPSLNSFRPAVISKKELQSVQAPVLLLIGDHEVIYKPEAAIKRARRWIPNIEAAIVPNGNHSSQYTAPEFVNSKIVEFLSSKEKRANRLEEEQA